MCNINGDIENDNKSSNTNKSSSGGISTSVIVAIVIALIVVILVVISFIIYFIKKEKPRKIQANSENYALGVQGNKTGISNNYAISNTVSNEAIKA